MRKLIVLLLICFSCGAAEKAAFDSNARIIALLSSDDEDLEVTSGLVAVLPNGKRVPLQFGRQGPGGIRRERGEPAWSGTFTLPAGGQGRIQLRAEEDAAGLRYSITVTAEGPLEVAGIDFALDLPRLVFVNGTLTPRGATAIPIPALKPPKPEFFEGQVAGLQLATPGGERTLDVGFDAPRAVSVVDRWDVRGRSFQLRAALASGPLERGATASLTAAFRLGGRPAPAPAVKLALDSSKVRHRFDGFGGNYCWSNDSPVSAYTLKNLKLAWARTEMKTSQWDKERDNPGRSIRTDMEMMRRIQQMGVPYVTSIWWLPERLYTDAYERPRSTHFRRIAPEKWPDALDLVGSYLLYAKREYGVEPDLFSFNEANIGVYVGFSPEDHAEAIKKFGAHFKKLGLKTRMLLGDATGPRDTHTYVLAAAADPEAMQYVGAVAFHSWGGATPAQYTAWGDVGEWLGLPLLVAELGVDAAAYYTRSWDSFHYGLREARMTQEIMIYARPQGTQFWQFTNDYSLARVKPDGAVEPTSRLWLMKHFTDLTPQKSEALTAASDQKQVLFTAFRRGGEHALHILNLGPAREAALEGLPDADWRAVTTTEAEHYQSRPAGRSNQGALRVALPARSLVTLTAGN